MTIYDKLDDQLMKGVNAGVGAWNWTTGKSKTDLANGMLTVAPILESVGFFNKIPILFIPLLLPIQLTSSHIAQKINRDIEKMENKALEQSALNIRAEYLKNRGTKVGLIWGVASTPWYLLHGNRGLYINDTTSTDVITGFGYSVRSLSYYVMRANNLPPRKNVLFRASQKVKEWAKELMDRPIGVPAPAYSKYFLPLEEKLR